MKRIISCLFILISLMLVSCSKPLEIQYSSPIYAMGTTIEITFYNTDNYQEHYNEIKKIYNSYNQLADTEGEANCIGALNKKRTIDASAELKELIEFSLEAYENTNGYFNPLIGRLTSIWKSAIKNKILPSSEVISAELEIMNASSIKIENNIISIIGEANIDLAAIAKGFATQKAKDYLKAKGIENYLINAGSSNIALGTKAGESLKAAIRAPYENKNITIYEGKNIDIVTSSGEHQNTIIDDTRYHHLINPFTGYPANNYESVSLLINDSGLGDAYSTAIFAMDIEALKSFVNENSLEVLIYNKEILFETEGWK